MVLPRIKITLPIEQKLQTDAHLARRGYLSFSEYVRDLIRRDLTQARCEAFNSSLHRAKKQTRASSKLSKAVI